MKSFSVRSLDFVDADMRAAYAFHRSWRSDGEEYFNGRILEVTACIERYPESFPKKYKTFHQAMLRRSHYALYYTVEVDCIIIIAVLDTRRDPKEIRSVLRTRRRPSLRLPV